MRTGPSSGLVCQLLPFESLRLRAGSELGTADWLQDEEQFGPVMPLIKYTDVEDAMERANATDFGLGGSVWTNDLEKGAELAARIQAGVRGVNAHPGGGPGTPFGGVKQSGIGREGGGQVRSLASWSLLAVCCMLLAACCSLLTACCMLLAACCSLLAAYCLLLAACCSLLTACCLLLAARCSLLTACCMLLAACCSLLAARCLLLAARCLLLAACCMLLAACCLLHVA